MRTAVINIFLFLCLSNAAQTKRIAHKSHSGAACSYLVFNEDGFGIAPEYTHPVARILKDNYKNIDTVVIVNDTTIVMHTIFKLRDTVYTSYNMHSLSVDSIRNLPYTKGIVFVKKNKSVVKPDVVPIENPKKKNLIALKQKDSSNDIMIYFYTFFLFLFVLLVYVFVTSKRKSLAIKSNIK